MQGIGEWVLVFALAASLFGPGPAQPAGAALDAASAKAIPALQSSVLQLTLPTACPQEVCAGGQRIGMRYEFDLNGVPYDATGSKHRSMPLRDFGMEYH